jgi:glucokinase
MSGRWVAGIDIGGTKIALAIGELCDDGVRLAEGSRRPTESTSSAAADLGRIADEVHALLDSVGARSEDLVAVGVSAPGPIEIDQGRLLHPPNLPGWGDVAVREVLASALAAPVHLENDANAAALAEWRYGAGRGCNNLVYLTMSTGIGAGLVLDGRLYRGAHGFGGEAGHVPVEWNGERCSCGLRGCFEAYAGGAAWTRRLRVIASEDGEVARRAGGVDRVTPEHVVEAARVGDEFALREMARFNHYVARGITGLLPVLAPDVVVLGTIPTAAGETLCLEPVREIVAENVWKEFFDGSQIKASELGDELPYWAGLCAALQYMDWGEGN